MLTRTKAVQIKTSGCFSRTEAIPSCSRIKQVLYFVSREKGRQNFHLSVYNNIFWFLILCPVGIWFWFCY